MHGLRAYPQTRKRTRFETPVALAGPVQRPTRREAKRRRRSGRPSVAHEAAQVRRAQGALEIAEAALLLYLARRLDEPAHRRAVKRASEADAAYSRRLELGDAERLALDAGHEVKGLGERGADLAY